MGSWQWWKPRAAGLLVVVAAAALVFAFRPAGTDPDDPAPAAESSASRSAPRATAPAVATDEDFCSAFRGLAEAQGLYVVDEEDGALRADLERAADALVATGVPRAMSLPARSGYFTLIGGVYDSIGLELERASVGAPGEAVEGGDAAFSSYLTQACPP